MSMRGAFISEPMLCCAECPRAVLEVMSDTGGWTQHVVLLADGLTVAGRINSHNNEAQDFELYWMPAVEERIKHNVRIAVLGEGGRGIFELKPVTP